MERTSGNSSVLCVRDIFIRIESTIVERAETQVRHPVFAWSEKAMDFIMADLQAMVEGSRIHRVTYRKLREMTLRSPPSASDS
jgi:hypothetical protein